MSIKTTAINQYNTAVIKQSGKVGTVRYVQRNGETYVRSAKNSKYDDRKSDAQMAQRMKFASLMAFGALLKNYITGAFQTKASNQSDINAFVHCNKGVGVYRSKDESETGYIVALPVTIARGNLGAVSTVINNGLAVSNIACSALASSATVATLSALLVAENENWSYGDQLTIISATQGANGSVKVKAIRIFLSKTDTTLLSALGTFSVSGGCLAYAYADQGCIGFIHSNKDGQVSESKMVASEAQQTLIDSLLTDDVFETDRETYGENNSNYIGGEGATGSATSGSSGSSSSNSSAKYTITATANPSSAGSVTGGGEYASGTQVTLKATAKSGYEFNSWSDGGTTATRTVTVTEDKTYTANFTIKLGGGDDDDDENGDPLTDE